MEMKKKKKTKVVLGRRSDEPYRNLLGPEN
jgi:hypothetical protein